MKILKLKQRKHVYIMHEQKPSKQIWSKYLESSKTPKKILSSKF